MPWMLEFTLRSMVGRKNMREQLEVAEDTYASAGTDLKLRTHLLAMASSGH